MRELGARTTPPPAIAAAPDVDAAAGTEEDLELDGELSEEISQLVDRLDVLRRHVDDLRMSVEDPVLARREMRNVEEEVEQVRAARRAEVQKDPNY